MLVSERLTDRLDLFSHISNFSNCFFYLELRRKYNLKCNAPCIWLSWYTIVFLIISSSNPYTIHVIYTSSPVANKRWTLNTHFWRRVVPWWLLNSYGLNLVYGNTHLFIECLCTVTFDRLVCSWCFSANIKNQKFEELTSQLWKIKTHYCENFLPGCRAVVQDCFCLLYTSRCV